MSLVVVWSSRDAVDDEEVPLILAAIMMSNGNSLWSEVQKVGSLANAVVDSLQSKLNLKLKKTWSGIYTQDATLLNTLACVTSGHASACPSTHIRHTYVTPQRRWADAHQATVCAPISVNWHLRYLLSTHSWHVTHYHTRLSYQWPFLRYKDTALSFLQYSLRSYFVNPFWCPSVS